MKDKREYPTGRRLITQNLVISATQAEKGESVTWSSIEDLSTLIDLCVLYDDLVVLTRSWMQLFHDVNTRFFDFMKEFLEEVDLANTEIEDLSRITQKHLVTFLGLGDVEEFKDLFEVVLAPYGKFHSFLGKPDGHPTTGRRWLGTPPNRSELLRLLAEEQNSASTATFLVRTFLYIAYADYKMLPLIPDAARKPIVKAIVDEEERCLREELRKQLKVSYAELMKRAPREVRTHISPFAAFVFDRSEGDRSRIAYHTAELREKLAPTRAEIKKLEQKILYGKGESKFDRGAEKQWGKIVTEAARAYGPRPGSIEVRRIVGFGRDSAEVIAAPTDVLKWLKLIGELPFELYDRFKARQPIIEIHSLPKEFQAPEAFRATLRELFGYIHSDE